MSGLEEAVLRNISAVNELSEIVRTSFGPNGQSVQRLAAPSHLEGHFADHSVKVETSSSSIILASFSSLLMQPPSSGRSKSPTPLVMASTAQESEVSYLYILFIR